ncbi:MAG: hypothetical protein ACO395_09750 [Pontimonas sp.]
MIHLETDLRSAGLVWLDRRAEIESILQREYPELDAAVLRSIVSGCQLYTTCRDEFFASIIDEASLPALDGAVR